MGLWHCAFLTIDAYVVSIPTMTCNDAIGAAIEDGDSRGGGDGSGCGDGSFLIFGIFGLVDIVRIMDYLL